MLLNYLHFHHSKPYKSFYCNNKLVYNNVIPNENISDFSGLKSILISYPLYKFLLKFIILNSLSYYFMIFLIIISH